MRTTKRRMFALVVMSLMVFVAGTVQADWSPGDPYKMHWPQLPSLESPFGENVLCTDPIALADDWQCEETGPVSDIHFWGGWEGDIAGNILKVGVGIFENIPADAKTTYSRPGEMLWDGEFDPGQFSMREYGVANFDAWGWYNPVTGAYSQNDSRHLYQINIVDIDNPFIQKQNNIYWLGLTVTVAQPGGSLTLSGGGGAPQPVWGWHTSADHFEDDAVWTDLRDEPDLTFHELRYPDGHTFQGQSMDLAFVITPEPATLGLLALAGGLAMLKRRRS